MTDKNEDEISVFGSGFFDDSGDVPGQPVLFYSLRGHFNRENRSLEIEKIYDQTHISKDLNVIYEGFLKLDTEDGQPIVFGKWVNNGEETSGTFAARLEE